MPQSPWLLAARTGLTGRHVHVPRRHAITWLARAVVSRSWYDGHASHDVGARVAWGHVGAHFSPAHEGGSGDLSSFRDHSQKTMYNQKIQSCHQDFQIRKVTCGLRSKTIVTHRNFRTPEDPSVISGIFGRVCAISGSSSRNRRSFRAWTRGIFGNGVSRRASTKFASRRGRVTVVSRRLRLEQRSEKGALRCQRVA